MTEPALDLSEIMDLYKEDARRMAAKMHEALSRWEEIRQGAGVRQELRRMAHQMRGSGRTYGFKHVTRYCKAIENIMEKLEKAKVPADDRTRSAIQKKVDRVAAAFAA